MICVEGYKAFRGGMRIVPISGTPAPFELRGDWLYKPQYDCWYGCGQSFGANICEIVEDEI